MKRVNYDLKVSTNFSGWVEYEKEDYTSDEFNNIIYDISFKEGEINFILLTFSKWNDEGELEVDSKFINPEKFKSSFWKKLPEYANFDECSWKRTRLTFEPSKNVTFSTFAHNTSCIV